jgi:hypothetical protein
MQPWRAMLVILLVSSMAFAAATDLTALVPAVAAVMIVVLALTNMIAVSISNPQLEAWAKTEMREFVAGVFLIGIIIALFISSNGISQALTGEDDYMVAAGNIITGWVDNLMAAYTDLITAAQKIRIAASYSSGTNVAIYWVSLTYQTSPLGGASVFMMPLSLATQGLTNAIFLSEGIRMLLTFFKIVTPKILLPLAFSLRLIPFTRKTGNTIIALALATIVFLPASVIFVQAVNDQIVVPQPRVADMGALDADPYPVYAFGAICESKFFRILFGLTDPLFALVTCLPLAVIPGAFPACYSLVWQVVYPIMSMIFQYANLILLIVWEGVVNPGEYGADVFNQLRPFLRDVTNLVLVIYMDVIFIGILTLSGARSVAAVIGGEWYMAGVQRLL